PGPPGTTLNTVMLSRRPLLMIRLSNGEARQVMLHEEPFPSAGHSARCRADCSCLCYALPGPIRSFHAYSERVGCRKRPSAAQKELGSFSCDALVRLCRQG